MTKTIAAIDGNSLMHRAYHAIQTPMTAPDGTPTNAVFGFLQMFLKFAEDARPDAVVCAFDAGKPEHRIAKMQRYKAQRPHMDEELRVQFPVIERLLAAMGVPVVKVPGWEGDDILGTIAARDEALGFKSLLVTGDKDACQLASDLTHIVTTKRGITDVAIMDTSAVREKYGVEPAQFCDFLGLMGDSSDNIPGVPGIGPKTAATLLQKYANIEGIYAHIDELRGKQRENLVDFKDDAFLSRDIATIKCDLDFSLDLEGTSFPAFAVADVVEAFRAYALNAPLARVLALVGESAPPLAGGDISSNKNNGEGGEGEVAAPKVAPQFILDPQAAPLLDLDVPDVQAAQADLAATFTIIEKLIAQDEPIGICVAAPALEQTSLFAPELTLALAATNGFCATLVGQNARDALVKIVREGSFVALDVKETLRAIYPADTALPAVIDDSALLNMRAFDLSLSAYILNSGKNEYTYAGLALDWLGARVELADATPDAATTDAATTIARAAMQKAKLCTMLAPALQSALDAASARELYEKVDLPLVGVLLIIERTGMAIDVARLAELGKTSAGAIEALSKSIYAAAGEEFNIDSPKQMSHVLFEVMGLNPPGKKTARGYSTNAKVLADLAKTEPIAADIIKYRELAKIKSTYIDALARLRAGDGRVHTHLHQCVTATGRLSSSDPNLQNIPVRSDFGRQIRECFVPLAPGELFMAADYSQIELRLLAHLSGDAHLIEAFNSGEDFHRQTASRVFGVPESEVTPQMRSRSKAVNFGIVYGQQAFGLAQTLDIPQREAREMIERYFEAYPGVREFLDRTVADAKRHGFATTMYGRRRYIPELASPNRMQRAAGERNAMNHPMQGSAADIIKLAMSQVAAAMAREGFAAKLIMQVHDELDFSVPKDEAEALGKLVKETMEGAAELAVPLVCEVGVAGNWASAH